MVGTSFPYIEFLPEPGLDQVRPDRYRSAANQPAPPGRCRARRRCEEYAACASPHAREARPRAFSRRPRRPRPRWQKLMEERGTRPDKPMKPQVVGWELGKRIPANAIVTSDSGTITTWWARYVPALRGQKHSCSGNLATMACGLPYAIAAAVAYPDRPVYCIIGDGGLSMLLGELITVAAYKLNIKIVVIKNNTLGQIKWEQMVFLGNPEYACDLYPADFVTIARGAGINAIQIDDPATCGQQLDSVVSIAWAGPDRSGCRSVHAADAGKDQGLASSQTCRSSGSRRTQSHGDRAHECARQGASNSSSTNLRSSEFLLLARSNQSDPEDNESGQLAPTTSPVRASLSAVMAGLSRQPWPAGP